MVAHTRTWTKAVDQVPADESTVAEQMAEILWVLKDTMVNAGPWTVQSSSDGVTANTSDNWVDSGDVQRHATTGSWIVLISPSNFPTTGSQLWFKIQWNTAADNTCNFEYSTAAYTGSPTTSSAGTGTNVESWANQIVLTHATTVAASRWHALHNTVGDIIFIVSKNGGGFSNFGLCLLAAANGQTGDNWPCFFFVNSVTTGQGPFEQDECYSTTHVRGPWKDGTTAADIMMCFPWNTQSAMARVDSSGDDITAEMPYAPISLQSTVMAKFAFRGTLVDVYAGPASVSNNPPQGTTTIPAGTQTHCLVGHLWMPFVTPLTF